MDGRENYLDYVANRPGVKALGEHGLWDAHGKVPSLENAVAEVARHSFKNVVLCGFYLSLLWFRAHFFQHNIAISLVLIYNRE